MRALATVERGSGWEGSVSPGALTIMDTYTLRNVGRVSRILYIMNIPLRIAADYTGIALYTKNVRIGFTYIKRRGTIRPHYSIMGGKHDYHFRDFRLLTKKLNELIHDKLLT